MSKRLKRWIDSAEKWYEEYKPFFVFFTAFGNASLVVFRIILFICER